MLQNADSHFANEEAFFFTAKGIREIVQRECEERDSCVRQRTLNAIEYALVSMKKQKRWFLSYKTRKDSTMQLVFNLGSYAAGRIEQYRAEA